MNLLVPFVNGKGAPHRAGSTSRPVPIVSSRLYQSLFLFLEKGKREGAGKSTEGKGQSRGLEVNCKHYRLHSN